MIEEKRNIHLVMPFSRIHLAKILTSVYEPMGIILHPIMFEDEATDFCYPWIKPLIIPMESKECTVQMPGCFKRNWFIKNNEMVDEDYYVTVDDDDMYEAGVFDTIKKMDDDIVIISMKRGYNIPDGVPEIRRYPTTTLYAHPDNVRIGGISAQQSFVKGNIFRDHLFNEEYHRWDGEMAMHHKESGEQIRYEPDLFALFNYYEPGRWGGPKISFGVLIDDPLRNDMVLRQSQIQGEMHYIRNPESATKGLNKLLEIIEDEGADIAILTHQDMYYRKDWLSQVKEQLAKLPDSWVVAGIMGKDMQGRFCGKFHTMQLPLYHDTSNIHTFPQEACCIDECCIIINMKKRFRFDENMDGFHLYGTLAVLQAWKMGGTAWIIDAFAEHYSLRYLPWFPDERFCQTFKWLYEKFNATVPRIDSTGLGTDSLPGIRELKNHQFNL